MRFGRLTVVKTKVFKDAWRKTHHLCKCDCRSGVVKSYEQSNLIRGASTSCGCRVVERAQSGVTALKHGQSYTPEFNIYRGMLDRCYNPKNVGYHRYGGRGIIVCKRWRGVHGFENFIADVGTRRNQLLTLGRINNDGPYSPDNCRWETQTQQCRNTCRNVLISFENETKTLVEWALRCPVTAQGLINRLRNGWPMHLAMTLPRGHARKR